MRGISPGFRCAQSGLREQEPTMKRLLLLAAMALAALPATASAKYPEYPIRILVTIPPGGAPDIAARLVAQRLSETVGWTVVVENRTGANGNVAGEAVAKAAPDGYTLILGSDSLIAINPHIYPKMPFDP